MWTLFPSFKTVALPIISCLPFSFSFSSPTSISVSITICTPFHLTCISTHPSHGTVHLSAAHHALLTCISLHSLVLHCSALFCFQVFYLYNPIDASTGTRLHGTIAMVRQEKNKRLYNLRMEGKVDDSETVQGVYEIP